MSQNSTYGRRNGMGSGYYRRKFIDPAYNPQYEVQESPWRYIRYAEILLSYAEASQELGEEAEARRAVNLVRNRSGMPNVDAGDLRESIRHERRVELMFEGQRYFDIRRWMIAPKVMADAQGIEIRYALGETNPTYKVIVVQKRSWKNQSYFLPIRLEEMNKNSLLVQNPLY